MSKEDHGRELARLAVFSQLDEDALRALAFSGDTRIFRTGDTLVRKGETSDCGYVLTNGSVTLRDQPGGAREVILGPGHMIGELAIITETIWVFTAVAREPTTAIRIGRAMFHRLLREHPASAARLQSAIARDLTRYIGELNDFAHRLTDKK